VIIAIVKAEQTPFIPERGNEGSSKKPSKQRMIRGEIRMCDRVVGRANLGEKNKLERSGTGKGER